MSEQDFSNSRQCGSTIRTTARMCQSILDSYIKSGNYNEVEIQRMCDEFNSTLAIMYGDDE